MDAPPKMTPLILFALGVLAFAALTVPEPSALAGISLPNLWFEDPRSLVWDLIQGTLKISGAILLALAAQWQAQRWGWSKFLLITSGGVAALVSVLLLLLPGMAPLPSKLLFWSFIIGTLVMISAGQSNRLKLKVK